MSNPRNVVRSHVVKVINTILYSSELAEERDCVLHISDIYEWAIYSGTAFMIELVALFSGIIYAEEAEYRCKFLHSSEEAFRRESLESLFHKFVDHLRDNCDLMDELYHTNFTRIMKIIMITDNKE